MAGDVLRVLVVDDSQVSRRLVSQAVRRLPHVQLLPAAACAREALDTLETRSVDLVLTDIDMPGMDGLELLGQITLRLPKVQVIVLSATRKHSAELTLQAVKAGALDFVPKPQGSSSEASVAQLSAQLAPLLEHCLRARRPGVNIHSEPPAQPGPAAVTPEPASVPAEPQPLPVATETPRPIPGHFNFVLIGVSTGGPAALDKVIPLLPTTLGVPVLVVIHMPPVFTGKLADALNRKSMLEVIEASDGIPVLKNTVYIAPGGYHMEVKPSSGGGSGSSCSVRITDSPPVNNCRPAVDVLFNSVARLSGRRSLAVVMTGMGSDGRAGVAELKRSGSYCLVQSAGSCVVYGMPGAVADAGLADEQHPLENLAGRISELVMPKETR